MRWITLVWLRGWKNLKVIKMVNMHRSAVTGELSSSVIVIETWMYVLCESHN